MTSTVVAMFEDFQSAKDAVNDLVNDGFSRDSISFIAGDESGRYTRTTGEPGEMGTSAAAEGAGVGAGVGAVLGGLGGLLVGLGALAIPGIGPVVAAGPLAAALTTLAGAGAGAVAGGVTGGLIGALVDMGVPEETAGYYAEGVRRGAHLVTVNVDDTRSNRAVEILNRHNPVDLNQRVEQWRQTGWVGFDEEAGAVQTTDRMRGRHDWPESGSQPPDANQGFQAGMPDVERVDEPMSTSRPASEVDWPVTAYEARDMDADETDDYMVYEDRFRTYFESSPYAGSASYSQYQPAYRYGYELARDDRYRDYTWEDLEPEARRYWDERNPGTWERFKDSVRHAWAEVRDALD